MAEHEIGTIFLTWHEALNEKTEAFVHYTVSPRDKVQYHFFIRKKKTNNYTELSYLIPYEEEGILGCCCPGGKRRTIKGFGPFSKRKRGVY